MKHDGDNVTWNEHAVDSDIKREKIRLFLSLGTKKPIFVLRNISTGERKAATNLVLQSAIGKATCPPGHRTGLRKLLVKSAAAVDAVCVDGFSLCYLERVRIGAKTLGEICSLILFFS